MRSLCLACVICLLFSCAEKKLEGTHWTLVKVIYKGDALTIRKPLMDFHEDGTVQLPGLGSPKISASWKVADNKIYFTIDSFKYDLLGSKSADLTFLAAGDSTETRSVEVTEVKDTTRVNYIVIDHDETTPRTIPFILKAMEVYKKPFSIRAQGDVLELTSDDTQLIARVQTFEDMQRERMPDF